MNESGSEENVQKVICAFFGIGFVFLIIGLCRPDKFVLIEIILGVLILFFGIVRKQYQKLKDLESKNIDFDKAIPLAWPAIFMTCVFFPVIGISVVPALISCSFVLYVFSGGEVGWIAALPPVKAIIDLYHLARAIIIGQTYFDQSDIDANPTLKDIKENTPFITKVSGLSGCISLGIIVRNCYLSVYITIFFVLVNVVIFNRYENFIEFGISLILQILMGILISMFFVNLINMTSNGILESSIKYDKYLTDLEITQTEQSVKNYIERKKLPSEWLLSLTYLLLMVTSVIGFMVYMFWWGGLFDDKLNQLLSQF